MPATYEPIATVSTTGGATSISFSSIPATYTDLRLVLIGTCNSNGNIFTRLNGDTASNYSQTNLIGNGTAASSTNQTSQSIWYLTLGQTTSTTVPFMYTLDIFSYAGATYKTALITQSADQNGSGAVMRSVSLWRSTSAINTVLFYVNAMNFTNGFTATLWGIKAA